MSAQLAPPSPEMRTVLLCEDDGLILFATAEVLREAGLTVIEAANASAALAAVQAHPSVAVLITDFGLPDMPGLELARRTRLQRPDLPVLFVTGEAAITGLDAVAGARLLLKPYRETELIGIVGELLAQR